MTNTVDRQRKTVSMSFDVCSSIEFCLLIYLFAFSMFPLRLDKIKAVCTCLTARLYTDLHRHWYLHLYDLYWLLDSRNLEQ